MITKLCNDCESELSPLFFSGESRSCRLCVKLEHLAEKHNPKWGSLANYTNEQLLTNSQICLEELTKRREKGPCLTCGEGMVSWFRKTGEPVDVFTKADEGGFAPTFLPTYIKHFSMFCKVHEPGSAPLPAGDLDIEAHFRDRAAKTLDSAKKRKFLMLAGKARLNKLRGLK